MDTPTELKYISLYSGAGGLDVAFKLANPSARAICYVEREASSIALLVDHMQTGQLDDAPVFADSGTFDGKPWRGKVDFIIGGFPCQPASVAGRRSGQDDERWLFPHIRRIVSEAQPQGLFLENVRGLLSVNDGDGFQEILRDLADLRYNVEWGVYKAADVGATHRRERTFIYAQKADRGELVYPYSKGCEGYERQAQIFGTASESGSAQIRSQLEGVVQSEHDPRSGKQLGFSDGFQRQRQVQESSDRPLSSNGSGGNVVNLADTHDSGDTTLRYGLNGNRSKEDEGWDEKPQFESTGYSDELGNSHGIRRRIEGNSELASEGIDWGRRPFPWPPRPTSSEWGDIIRERPDLAPAKPQIRGMVDGLAGGLGRADKLRILGNGVVPQQAAVAFLLLQERMANGPN